MKRLQEENINTPELADRIFEQRWRKQVHYVDFNRFVLLSKYFSGGKCLDLGVFNSPLPIELRRKFPESEIWAIDHATTVIEHFKKQFPDIHYIVGDVMRLPFENESFDYLIAGELIEHLEDPEAFLKECFRVLRPKGYLAISAPVEEGVSQARISSEHLWSFDRQDFEALSNLYDKVEIDTFQEATGSTVNVFIVYCQKK
jgi:ubiquinone/menaquinone biosynthesis C-methylase UbiE